MLGNTADRWFSRRARCPAKPCHGWPPREGRSRAEPEACGASKRRQLLNDVNSNRGAWTPRGEKAARGMDAARMEAGKERSDEAGRPGRRRPPRRKRDEAASEHEASARPPPWMAAVRLRPHEAADRSPSNGGVQNRGGRVGVALGPTSGRPRRGRQPEDGTRFKQQRASPAVRRRGGPLE